MVRGPYGGADRFGCTAPTVDHRHHHRAELRGEAGVENELIVQPGLARLPAEIGTDDDGRRRVGLDGPVTLEEVLDQPVWPAFGQQLRGFGVRRAMPGRGRGRVAPA